MRENLRRPLVTPTLRGVHRGGERAAAMLNLVETAKVNGVDPQAWLADLLRRIANHPASKLDELPP